MKTPSFLELKTLVEYLADELAGSQLQEVLATEEGLVISFYRFNKIPKMVHVIFDLDRLYPFLGFFAHNPWSHTRLMQKKTKPVSLFLNAHAKNRHFKSIEIFAELGRVVQLNLEDQCQIEFRLIPKQANLIVRSNAKSISWYPVKELAQNDLSYTHSEEEDVRSILFMMNSWLKRRGAKAPSASASLGESALSPFEKWKKNKEKDLVKKKKALIAVEEQIQKFKSEEWAAVGEYLKTHGLKNLRPEWSIYIDYKKSVSSNMQQCFEKAKAAKSKIIGASSRLSVLQQEVLTLTDLTEEKYEQFLSLQNLKKNKAPERKVEGRLRKTLLEDSGLVAYLGKSAADNMSLLRRAKPHDIWLHLKDYPSAHAIIHTQKNQKVSDLDVKKIAAWLVKEGLSDTKAKIGNKYAVILAECRHVKPLKGDKLGRVTYHNAREILIAI